MSAGVGRKPTCKKRVYSGERADFGGHTCTRLAKENGLCAMHQPEAAAARKSKLEAKWAAESAARSRQYRIEEAGRDVITAAKKWLRTGNDAALKAAVMDLENAEESAPLQIAATEES